MLIAVKINLLSTNSNFVEKRGEAGLLE